jgi:hypothetical protein
MGYGSQALGNYSVATGYKTIASGESSFAMGKDTKATMPYSVAMGDNTTASGKYSFAMGYGSKATGDYSTAMGYNAIAKKQGSVAIGGNAIADGTTYSMAFGAAAKATGDTVFAFGYGVDQYGVPADANTSHNSLWCDHNNKWYTADGQSVSSDDRIKHNETEINGIEVIKQLRPLTYFKSTQMYDENHNYELDENGKPIEPIDGNAEKGIKNPYDKKDGDLTQEEIDAKKKAAKKAAKEAAKNKDKDQMDPLSKIGTDELSKEKLKDGSFGDLKSATDKKAMFDLELINEEAKENLKNSLLKSKEQMKELNNKEQMKDNSNEQDKDDQSKKDGNDLSKNSKTKLKAKLEANKRLNKKKAQLQKINRSMYGNNFKWDTVEPKVVKCGKHYCDTNGNKIKYKYKPVDSNQINDN